MSLGTRWAFSRLFTACLGDVLASRMLPLAPYEAYGKVYSWPLERFVEVLSVRAQRALPRASWRRFPLGCNFVFALGEAFVLKLVPPFWAHDAAREMAALRAV